MRYHTGTLRLTSGPLRIASKNKWALDKRVVRRRSAQREPVGLHLENKMQVPTMRREWEYFNECQYVQNWTLIGESKSRDLKSQMFVPDPGGTGHFGHFVFVCTCIRTQSSPSRTLVSQRPQSVLSIDLILLRFRPIE